MTIWGGPRAERFGPVHRYVVRLTLEPSGERIEYSAVTGLGELKAAAMAALRLLEDMPDARFSTIEITSAEKDFELDPVNDMRDYWGTP